MTLLRAQSLSVGYRDRRRVRIVLEDLDLQIAAGELVCLVGPNGSGKSTLLRTIAGMQHPLHGTAFLDGADVTRLAAIDRARRLAVVLTDAVDVGMMRAVDLVALGRYPYTGWDGRLGPADREAVAWALRTAGASELAQRSVAELSDGERQRVLIARALAQQPSLLALDEPMAFVDVPRRVELLHLLRALARQSGLGVLLTTHDLDLAIRTADTLWLLEPAESGPAVLHAGAPEDLVLSGTVARAFSGGEVQFDLERGSFLPLTAGLALARVVGDGPAAVWARRALEREDLAVVDDPDVPITVEVVGEGWRLRLGEEVTAHQSLGDLLATLRARQHGGAPHPERPTPKMST